MTSTPRRFPRHVVFLECQWEGSSKFSPSRINDISMGGCYVDSRVVPEIGQTIEIAVTLGGVPVTLRGIVRQAQPLVGFGVEFADLDGSAVTQLETYLSSPGT